MIKRTEIISTKDHLAIGKEYKGWINCIKSKKLIPKGILFIKTYNFQGKFI